MARYAVRAMVVSIPLLFLALLAFGDLAQSPSTTIDDSLARGQAPPAPAFSLALLRHGDLRKALDPQLAGALRDGRASLHALRGVPAVLNVWASRRASPAPRIRRCSSARGERRPDRAGSCSWA